VSIFFITTESSIELVFWGEGFLSHPLVPTWCCATMFLIGYLVVLIACFLYLDLIFVLSLTWMLARLMCSFCPWPGGVI
jgi:hypothetical protein